MVGFLKRIKVKDVVTSVVISLCVTIVGVLLFALVVKFLSLSSSAVLIGNTVIKLLSIFLGNFLGIKEKVDGALKGAFSGVIYVLLSYFIFSLLSGEGLFAGINIVGVLFGVIVGLISGIISVNLHK